MPSTPPPSFYRTINYTMLITKQIEIDMGHRVPNHKSKCRNPHGHRYKIEVGVDDKLITESGSSDEGMVIDFGDLKEIMMEKIDAVYDHSYTLWNLDEHNALWKAWKDQGFKVNLTQLVPTAENLARIWYEAVEGPLRVRGIKIAHVTVWETPTSTATYKV